ncbi:mechanosensitive ion channel family protein [Pedobacter sp. HDW13]|uniref:mechanosensitive ion channel family protein n=1 Tax=Pedobacter sp. HDW13 TaxID=2714940 RepID=UPI00140E5517|nr:mechanosensitive ion channel family protein [Pedobacter sp. HDW13]QIL41215.1 mechanosensitive ion channel family protein [Pedobacter sp. HDW13]
MKRLFTLHLFALVFLGTQLYAQTDSLKKPVDSTQIKKMNSGLDRVSQLSAERIADSLKRDVLQKQVNALGKGDDTERNRLLLELGALKKKDSLQQVKQVKQIDSLRKFIKGVPVVFNRDTLFYIYAKLGSFSAADRAQAIANRLEKIAGGTTFHTDSLKLSQAESSIDLIYGNNLLLSINEEDAIWAKKDINTLSADVKAAVGKSVINYRDENSLQVIIKEILLTLLVIAVVIGLVYLVNRLFRTLTAKLLKSEGRLKDGIRIKNYQLLDPDRQLWVIGAALSIARWIIIILLIYLALPVLFGIFPFTKDLSENLLAYILGPLKKIGSAIWNYIPDLMTILVLLVVFRYVLRFVRFIKTEVERGKLTIPGFYKDWANPTYQIIRVLILAFMLIVIFPYLPGSDSGVFKGVSVFMGVLFTFGSAGALGNVVAGLVLTYMRAFRIGDRVKIGEVTGDIIEKTLLVTRVRTIQNEVVSIPNSTVMSNHTINYSVEASEKGLIIHTTVTIGYDAPWRQVHQLLIDAALSSDMIEADPKPYVLQTSLDDYYVSYCINAHTKSPNKQALIYSSLHANIQDIFNEAGVEIMSPHYKALRDGNETTIPAAHLPKDYSVPVFRTSTRMENTDPKKTD